MKKLRFALKLSVSVFLIAFIFYKFPISDILTALKNVNYFWLAVSFLLGELIILSQALRWHYLLIVPKEQKPEFGILLKYTAVGYFFNMFVPSGIGGDVYRSIALGRARNVIASSVASVFVAKMFGLLALCLLFWFALPHTCLIPEQVIWFMALATLLLIAFCLFMAFNPLKKGKLGEIATKLKEYREYPFRLLFAMLGSFLMQILVVFMQISLFYAVGMEISIALVFVIVPATAILTTIPISLNGIGVREWGMLYLTVATINSGQLLASLFLGYALIILYAVQGGVLFSASKQTKR
jgi:uncharacterized membrane protein YbhN (UPF0104 family)